MNPTAPITELLSAAKHDEAKLEELFDTIYPNLRRLAKSILGRHSRGKRVGATELINDSFAPLKRAIEHPDKSFENRRYFFAYAARVLSGHVTDLARQEIQAEELPEDFDIATASPWLRYQIGNALEKLREKYPRQAEVFELTYYSGFKAEQVAELLEISVRSVRNDLAIARGKLRELLLPGRQFDTDPVPPVTTLENKV